MLGNLLNLLMSTFHPTTRASILQEVKTTRDRYQPTGSIP